MKKIIFVMLMFFCLIYDVSAKEIYYSDYGNFSEYSTKKIESTELVNVVTERRYKFYENKMVGEYRKVTDDNSNFQHVDRGDRKDSEYTSWSKQIPNSIEERTIETKTMYFVKRPKPIKSFKITNSGDTDITVKDIEIYYLAKKLDYDVSSLFTSRNYTVHSGGHLILYLKEYYNLEDIIIKIGEAKFDEMNELHISATVPSEDNSYQISYFRVNLDNGYKNNIAIDSSYWIRTNAQYEHEVVEDKDPNENLSIVRKENYYRYQDPLFYFYNLEKVYIDGYFKEHSELIKDETDFKDFYRYQVRDKCEIDDEIIITNSKETLEHFINCTTDYGITTNLNINKNGVYQAEFTTKFMSIKKDVIVDIKANEMPIEDNEDKLNEITNKYEQSLKDRDDLKIQNNLLKEQNNKIVNKNNSLNNKLSNLLNDYNHLEQNLVLKDLECKVCDSKLKAKTDKDINLNIVDKSNIYCILLIILIFILLLIILKKMSDKNKF